MSNNTDYIGIRGEVLESGENNIVAVLGEVGTNAILGDVQVGGVVINEVHGLTEIPPATTGSIGGVIVGDHLDVTQDGYLSVIVADSFDGDNTHPISAGTVYSEIGNINALLYSI